MNKFIYIYYLHKGDNIPFYIGKTKNCNNRISGHRLKYGLNTFLEKLDLVENKECKFWESYWIGQFKNWGFNLVNKNKGGGGLSFHTLESKQKISNSWNLKSQKEKDKINKKRRLGNKGVKKPKSGYRNWKKEDIDRVIKTSPFNQPDWKDKCKKPVVMLNKNTGEIISEFGSVSEASYILGINQSTLSHHLTGRTRTCAGYKWKYKIL